MSSTTELASKGSLLTSLRANARRVLKSLLGLALIGVVSRAVFVTYVLTYSSDAVVTSTRTTVRSPIKGIVRHDLRGIGQLVGGGEVLATVKDELIDESRLHELKERLIAAEAERDAAADQQRRLEAIRQELSGGASRAHEVDLRLAELLATHSRLKPRAAALAAEVDAEASRVSRMRESRLLAPFRGRIWRTFVASEEYVSEGKSLFELVDCSHLLVIAWVPERNFQRIHIGTEATLRLSGSSKSYPATVVQLVGALDQLPDVVVGEARAATAAQSAAQQYAVILAVPELAEASSTCELGHSAEVRFHADAFSN